MKYIKTFESLIDYKVGDYVLIIITAYFDLYRDFINNTIGRIVKITPVYSHNYRQEVILKYYNIEVSYSNVPVECANMFIKTKNDKYRVDFPSYMIYKYSKNKEDLEIILNSKKFNL